MPISAAETIVHDIRHGISHTLPNLDDMTISTTTEVTR